jgi:hypothetical protein
VLNTLSAPQVVPKRKPTVAEEAPPPEIREKPSAPVNRAPPLPGGGGMDDLFGAAAQEGRVRIGRPKKDTK